MIYADNVVFEITRRCNMVCSHCLRGDRSQTDMSKETMNNALRMFDSIGTVTFTGGEPSLRPSLIRHFVDACYHYRVECNSYFIATNGKRITKVFTDAVTRLHYACDTDDEISSVKKSVDPWHEWTCDRQLRKLEELPNFTLRKASWETRLVSEGYSNGSFGARVLKPQEVEVDIRNDAINILSVLYVNAYGRLLTDCDLSYESQKNKKWCLGNVNTLTPDSLMENVKAYNEKFDAVFVPYITEHTDYGEAP